MRSEYLKCAQLIFDKGAKAVQWVTGGLFNKRCWSLCTSRGENRNFDVSLTHYAQSNRKRIMDLNAIRKTMKLLGKNHRREL